MSRHFTKTTFTCGESLTILRVLSLEYAGRFRIPIYLSVMFEATGSKQPRCYAYSRFYCGCHNHVCCEYHRHDLSYSHGALSCIVSWGLSRKTLTPFADMSIKTPIALAGVVCVQWRHKVAELRLVIDSIVGCPQNRPQSLGFRVI